MFQLLINIFLKDTITEETTDGYFSKPESRKSLLRIPQNRRNKKKKEEYLTLYKHRLWGGKKYHKRCFKK